jgi:hypothetical protein
MSESSSCHYLPTLYVGTELLSNICAQYTTNPIFLQYLCQNPVPFWYRPTGLVTSMLFFLIIFNKVPNYMKNSHSRDTNSSSSSQRISCILWNLKVHNHVYRSLPFNPVVILINLVHAFPSYFFKICINIILKSMLRSSKWSLLFLQLLIIPRLFKKLPWQSNFMVFIVATGTYKWVLSSFPSITLLLGLIVWLQKLTWAL